MTFSTETPSSRAAEAAARLSDEALRLLEIITALDSIGALVKAAWLAASNSDEVPFAFGDPLAAILDVVSKQLEATRNSASSLHDDMAMASRRQPSVHRETADV